MIHRRSFIASCLAVLAFAFPHVAAHAAAHELEGTKYTGIQVVARTLSIPSGGIKIELKLSNSLQTQYTSPWMNAGSPQLPSKQTIFASAITGQWTAEITYRPDSGAEQLLVVPTTRSAPCHPSAGAARHHIFTGWRSPRETRPPPHTSSTRFQTSLN